VTASKMGDTTGEHLTLFWPVSASEWSEATPLGNGMIGACAFGGPGGRYQINDAFGWSGDPADPDTALDALVDAGAGPDRLREARRAIDSDELTNATILMKTFEGRYSQEFLPFVDAFIEVRDATPLRGRELDLDSAILTELFLVGTAVVTRRSWTSHPDRVLCVEITSDAPVDVSAKMCSSLREGGRISTSDSLIVGVPLPLDGAPLHEPGEPAHRWRQSEQGYDPYGSAALTVRSDGRVSVSAEGIDVNGGTSTLFVFGTATRAERWWGDRDPMGVDRGELDELARKRSTTAADRGALALLQRHREDIEPRLAACNVRIGERRAGVWDIPSEVLGVNVPTGVRATVLIAYGRYLLLAASRDGGPAANLQGIWNADPRPAWSSNYTININTQMNYWPSDVANVDGSFEPLVRLLEVLARRGESTASALYGTRGWVAHHNSDLWGWTAPTGMGHGDVNWAIWPMGGIWLCQNLWDHWDYTRDVDYLLRIWPVMRSAALFLLDWWVKSPTSDVLRTIPSTSPENVFVREGVRQALGSSSELDRALTRAHFTRVQLAIAELGITDSIEESISAALDQLPAVQIGRDGRILEWGRFEEEAEPSHRHLSPAAGLYPLGEFFPASDPEIAAAIERFIAGRGNGAMGWSWAWKIALRARLGDASTALSLFDEASRPYLDQTRKSRFVDGYEWGGLMPNLLSSGPPFQIDGNLGITAALMEMLIQSSPGRIRLLPALPAEWSEGSVVGARARGGVIVDLEWRESRLRSATLHNSLAAEVTVVVQVAQSAVTVTLSSGGVLPLDVIDGELTGR
jgi:alpha-L-fucosidase 2